MRNTSSGFQFGRGSKVEVKEDEDEEDTEQDQEDDDEANYNRVSETSKNNKEGTLDGSKKSYTRKEKSISKKQKAKRKKNAVGTQSACCDGCALF